MHKIRQILTVLAGHVDSGKTSILDFIRGTFVVKGEAGGITQSISCTNIPLETIKKTSGDLFKQLKMKIQIPGFLMMDTPGHASFNNLRKRGGNLADIGILVVDINEGINTFCYCFK